MPGRHVISLFCNARRNTYHAASISSPSADSFEWSFLDVVAMSSTSRSHQAECSAFIARIPAINSMENSALIIYSHRILRRASAHLPFSSVHLYIEAVPKYSLKFLVPTISMNDLYFYLPKSRCERNERGDEAGHYFCWQNIAIT